MVQLDLSRDEVGTLVSVLKHELSDLSYEIANTDSQDYRESLKTRKQVLAKVIDALTLNRQTV